MVEHTPIVEKGYNPDGTVAWVRYPETGDAWQKDAFIVEETQKFMREFNQRRKNNEIQD